MVSPDLTPTPDRIQKMKEEFDRCLKTPAVRRRLKQAASEISLESDIQRIENRRKESGK